MRCNLNINSPFVSLSGTFIKYTEHKICIVGLDNAGKTTILYQFLMNEVVQTSPTIGSNVEVKLRQNLNIFLLNYLFLLKNI